MRSFFLSMNYIKTAWRNLARNKVYSIINIAGLSIGLACCMLIILFNNDEISFDRFHTNAKNIYRIVHDDRGPNGELQGTNGITGLMPGPVFKKDIPEISDYVRLYSEVRPVKIGTEIFEQEVQFVDDNFFSVFTFPLVHGSQKDVLKDKYSVVLSERVAKKFFGTSNVVGKTIELPKRQDHDAQGPQEFETFVVTGITPESPQNSSIKIDMLLPMTSNEGGDEDDGKWLNFFLNTFVVLHPDADIFRVEAKMKESYKVSAGEQLRKAKEKYNFNTTWDYKLQPLLGMHLSKDYPPDNGLKDASKPVFTRILAGIALFMLIIACINFVNLTVARSLKRAKEIGLRKVFGASVINILELVSYDFIKLVIIGFLIATPVAWLITNKWLEDFAYKIDITWGIFLLAGLTAVIIALLTVSFQAIKAAIANPVKSLRTE